MSAYLIGAAYKTLGDYDQAFNWWTRAVERYEAWTLLYMPARNRNDPVIGKDPRFLALLKRMGLEGEGEKKGGLLLRARIQLFVSAQLPIRKCYALAHRGRSIPSTVSLLGRPRLGRCSASFAPGPSRPFIAAHQTVWFRR